MDAYTVFSVIVLGALCLYSIGLLAVLDQLLKLRAEIVALRYERAAPYLPTTQYDTTEKLREF